VFLNAVRKSKTPLTMFLVNGVKLQGVVTWFDNFCVLLRRDGQIQLVYKHAISTIMPGAPVQLFDPAQAEEIEA
jgi:host factor-I protein